MCRIRSGHNDLAPLCIQHDIRCYRSIKIIFRCVYFICIPANENPTFFVRISRFTYLAIFSYGLSFYSSTESFGIKAYGIILDIRFLLPLGIYHYAFGNSCIKAVLVYAFRLSIPAFEQPAFNFRICPRSYSLISMLYYLNSIDSFITLSIKIKYYRILFNGPLGIQSDIICYRRREAETFIILAV